MKGKTRINKYLAEKGITTRRGADALIESGKVFINGRKALLGDKVGDTDKVEVKGAPEKQYKYFLYNKPIGLSTEEIITHLGNKAVGLFPVGRLDKASHGIILLTNDGRITDRLLNPESTHEKEYKVRVKGHLRSSFKAKMEAGVQIEDYKTKPCKVEVLDADLFKVTLIEGKKHQIRRMCVALFQEVEDLERIRIVNLKIGPMRQGALKAVEGKELTEFKKRLGLA